ncbi:putative glyoxalase superfamily protein PhnB [Kribbella steppae]|uniref:Putative glyoxalase superfamily protein PhnB n=1 Tax=Kribbella steppae TaxID=2512223 RepID=A0A4R2H4M8_9ACTN|nr:VOC family protein [Kribbella steppae]TCO20416.1 putative glyoxalase superfamily protein PhnB [Kribbella steppae]
MQASVNALDIAVGDLGTAIEFYRRLGLEFVRDQYMPEDHAGCDLPNGLHLMLDTDELRGKITAGWTPPKTGRIFLTTQLDSPAAVDAKYAELTAAGVTGLQEPFDAPWRMRYATVADPSGNGIDLYADLPAD